MKSALRLVVFALAACSGFSSLTAADLTSPDQRWWVNIKTSPRLVLTLSRPGGEPILRQEVSMTLADGREFAGGTQVVNIRKNTINRTVQPVAPVKSATIHDHANEIVFDFTDAWSFVVRVYDDGFAYRFTTGFPGEISVADESSRNTFSGDPTVWYGAETDFYSHNEVSYDAKPLSAQSPGALTSLPLLVRTANGGPALLFSESALEDYPGQWMRIGADGQSLVGAWPALPTRVEETDDRNIIVRERGRNLAVTQGTRVFPWRFVGIAATDAELLTNQLAFLLAEPSRVEDTSWIKPGKVQWDWWHDCNVWDTDFRGGVSQALYRHYIDFAKAHDAKYIILDEGWYELGDLTKPQADIDVPALVAHGREQRIGVILWASWSTLKKQFHDVMPLFERWGVAGLKVDFFQRDDQPAVQFYWQLAEEGARRKLLLDFHGAHKPAGLNRTFPNVLTFEGVKGLEHHKWSDAITPEHNTTLPFIRQVAGPMDYTPGAMDNAQRDQFRINFRRAMSQGTRCHQLAMYVVFESPLQMFADSPSAYRREPGTMEFLDRVPTTWDETRVLAAEVGTVVALARRSGDWWFLGALNNSQPRALDLDLSFLPADRRTLKVWQDGPNADRDGRDVAQREMTIPADGKLHIDLAPGGGWVAIAGR